MERSVTQEDVAAALAEAGVSEWGVAANDGLPMAPDLPTAISLLVAFEPAEVAGVEHGPTPPYYAGYNRVNAQLDAAADGLVELLRAGGHTAQAVRSTVPEEDYDRIDDWCNVPVFAHKTAATRAGLGWIGKTALFLSPLYGPRLRLATVFTDLVLPPGTPVENGRCGRCRACIDACPAGAGVDVSWRAGMPRDELYDARACEKETEKYDDLGGVCGVCMAVCPWGKRAS